MHGAIEPLCLRDDLRKEHPLHLGRIEEVLHRRDVVDQRETVAGHGELVLQGPHVGQGDLVIFRRPVGLFAVGRIEDGMLALHDVADVGGDLPGVAMAELMMWAVYVHCRRGEYNKKPGECA